MAAGGIHDQLGGGFARYSVDARWLVPHFEKMLYDNALLARSYLRGWQELGNPRYREVCAGILDWALAEMRGPEGGFYSALDADSEGEEGRFYTWTPAEARAALEAAGLDHLEPAVLAHFGISHGGHLDGRSVLHLPGGLDAEPPAGIEAREGGPAGRPGRARPAGARRQAALRLERADGGGDGGGRGGARGAALRRGRGRLRRLPARDDARRRRPAAAHLQRRGERT